MGDELAVVEGHVSVGGMSLKAILDLEGSVKDLTETIRQALIAQETAYEANGPIFAPLQGQGLTGASGGIAFSLGGPTPLRRWEVRQVVVGGILTGDSRAGNAWLAISPVNPLPIVTSTPSVVSIQWSLGSSYPAVETFSAGQFTLRSPDQLWVIIAGGTPTATATYTASGNALDLPDVRSPGQTVNI